MKARIAILGVSLALFSTLAQAWWDENWEFRKEIIIAVPAVATPGTAVPASPVADVPVLIRLHTGNFGFFQDVQPGGADLRFMSADDKLPLKYHIEKFDPINEMALIWVKLPQLVTDNTSASIRMYYGNKAAVKAEDVAGSYDPQQVLVYHFSDSGATQDQTAYGNHPAQMMATVIPAGIIGAGASFAGNNTISIPATPSLPLLPDPGWTFSSWVKINAAQQNATLFHAEDGMRSFNISINDTGVYATVIADDGTSFATPPTAVMTPGSWHHLAVTVSQSQIILYLDGVQKAVAQGVVPVFSGPKTLGATANGTQYFSGEIDEVQLAKIARSPQWIQAAFSAQSIDGTIIQYGEDQARDSEETTTSYLQVILQNVTVDGWAVIGILIVMAMVSWLVMLIKAIVIGRTRKDNKKFLEAFQEISAINPEALDAPEDKETRELGNSPFAQALFGKHDHYQSSSIYHIYHAGINELKHRAARAVGAQASGLSPQALNSIRATLDATMVRETQKLNNQMVLLTIAISGGPFLGLLGTVVGVMITFAAIAASGDVNVNAIAPGIAAALVATVAGLAVAIPALFGYNYLSSRIRDISMDMRVFVDEFISKMAEHYT